MKISYKIVKITAKWLIIGLAYTFLVYKLICFDKYDSLLNEWTKMPVSQVWWFGYVLALLPINWMLEAIKWRRLLLTIEKLNWTNTIKGVVAGITTGFFTPNRVGEMAGRIVYLPEEKRKAGVTACLLNSITQNTIMTVCGIPACIIFFSNTQGGIESDMAGFLLLMILLSLGLITLYWLLPKIGDKLSNSNLSDKAKAFIICLKYYSKRDLIVMMGISLGRYIVFCTQFYCMLHFFGINLSIWQALIAIPSNYLLVTFTPSLAYSEAAVRSSASLLFIGAYSSKVVNIALAGISIWAVNFVIPMIIGTLVMLLDKSISNSTN
jgi:hypothetical protein